MKSNNILLGYVLIGLQNTFFWYAVWLLYLFKFIDITQLVFLQAVGLVTSVIAEVPTGALSDLIGKKKTLQIAFLVTGIGEVALSFSRDFSQFLATWVVLNVGYSFFSGTMEAFIYDSLVEKGEEHKYSKVLSKNLSY